MILRFGLDAVLAHASKARRHMIPGIGSGCCLHDERVENPRVSPSKKQTELASSPRTFHTCIACFRLHTVVLRSFGDMFVPLRHMSDHPSPSGVLGNRCGHAVTGHSSAVCTDDLDLRTIEGPREDGSLESTLRSCTRFWGWGQRKASISEVIAAGNCPHETRWH